MHFQKKDGYFSKSFHTKKEMGKMTSLGNKKKRKGKDVNKGHGRPARLRSYLS